MNHDEMKERLMEFYDGELPEGARRAVEEHLTACRPCAETLRRWEKAARILFKDRPVPAPDLAAGVMARLDAADGRTVSTRESWWAGGWTPAFGVGLAALLVAVAWPEREAVPSAETLLLEDGGDVIASFLQETPKADDVLGLVMEDL